MTTAVGHDALRAQLLAGSETLGLGLTDAQVTLLMDFQALLQKWNKVYNLTAVRDPQEMMTHHLLDSLAAVAPLRRHAAALAGEGRGGVRLLDVGSGGGLPGVVFAICCPEVDVSCVDTVGKKAAFIQQAAVALKLDVAAPLKWTAETPHLYTTVLTLNNGAELLSTRTGFRKIEIKDRVYRINGVPVKNIDQVRSAVAKADKSVALLIQRGDSKIFVPVTIG